MTKLQPTLLRTDEIDALIDMLPADHTVSYVQGKRGIYLTARRAAVKSYPDGGLPATYRLTGGLIIEASYARPKGFSLQYTAKQRLRPGWTTEEAIRIGNATYVQAMRASLLDAARKALMDRFDTVMSGDQPQIGEEAETDAQKIGLTTLYDEMDIDTIERWHDWLTRHGVPELPKEVPHG